MLQKLNWYTTHEYKIIKESEFFQSETGNESIIQYLVYRRSIFLGFTFWWSCEYIYKWFQGTHNIDKHQTIEEAKEHIKYSMLQRNPKCFSTIVHEDVFK